MLTNGAPTSLLTRKRLVLHDCLRPSFLHYRLLFGTVNRSSTTAANIPSYQSTVPQAHADRYVTVSS